MLMSSWLLMTLALTWSTLTRSTGQQGSTARGQLGPQVSHSASLTGETHTSAPVKRKRKREKVNGLRGLKVSRPAQHSPKARWLLHMECDCSSHTIYEDYYPRESRLFEQEHHAASAQIKKYSEGTLCEVQELHDGGFRSTRRPATTWLRRAQWLNRPGVTGYLTWHGSVPDMG